MRHEALPLDRIRRGRETGGCPHAAIREEHHTETCSPSRISCERSAPELLIVEERVETTPRQRSTAASLPTTRFYVIDVGGAATRCRARAAPASRSPTCS